MIKLVNETIKNAREQRVEFFGMSLVTLGTSLLENMLARKGIIRSGKVAVKPEETISEDLIAFFNEITCLN